MFFPQDGDNLARTTAFSFRLRSAATVSWTVENAAGAVVRTIKTGEALAAGPHAFTWNGRNDAGAMVPRGTYRTVVTRHGRHLRRDPEGDRGRRTPSASRSATRPRGVGQRITVTATSAETLDRTPRLRVYQPGIAAWSVTMRKIDTRVYRITVTLKSSKTGTLKLRVSAPDDGGRCPGVEPVPAAPLTDGPHRTAPETHRTGSDRDHRPLGALDRGGLWWRSCRRSLRPADRSTRQAP